MSRNEPQHDKYRFVTACKKCGVTDEQWRTAEEAKADEPTNHFESPAFQHYDRTGHTVLDVNYTIAPYDVQQMLDDGRPDAIDFERVAEVVAGNGKEGEA